MLPPRAGPISEATLGLWFDTGSRVKLVSVRPWVSLSRYWVWWQSTMPANLTYPTQGPHLVTPGDVRRRIAVLPADDDDAPRSVRIKAVRGLLGREVVVGGRHAPIRPATREVGMAAAVLANHMSVRPHATND